MFRHRALIVAVVIACLCAVPTAQITTNDAVYGRLGLRGVLAKKASLNLNQTNTDNAVTIAAGTYVVRAVTVTNCSTSLGASAATIGVFTGAGGTGTTVVALGLLTALSAATKYLDLTLALTTDTLAATTLYIRNGITHGAAATCDVYIVGDILP